MNKTPRDYCQITPRICEEKGWGVILPGYYNNWCGRRIATGSRIGEVFAYHKNSPSIYSNLNDQGICNPNFEVGTVKILYIARDKKLSLHFHLDKEEIFYMVTGDIELTLISNGIKQISRFSKGESLLIKPGMVHQMKGLSDENILLEISTLDCPNDSYRIEKGD